MAKVGKATLERLRRELRDVADAIKEMKEDREFEVEDLAALGELSRLQAEADRLVYIVQDAFSEYALREVIARSTTDRLPDPT